MDDRRAIAALEQWLKRFPDPRPSAHCLQQVKSGVSAALQDTTPALNASAEVKERIKAAVRVELTRRRPAQRLGPMAWAGTALATAAGLALMLMVPAGELSEGTTSEDANIQIASIYEDPELAGLASDLADLELRNDALEYFLEAPDREDSRTLRLLEPLTTPDYRQDIADPSS